MIHTISSTETSTLYLSLYSFNLRYFSKMSMTPVGTIIVVYKILALSLLLELLKFSKLLPRWRYWSSFIRAFSYVFMFFSRLWSWTWMMIRFRTWFLSKILDFYFLPFRSRDLFFHIIRLESLNIIIIQKFSTF